VCLIFLVTPLELEKVIVAASLLRWKHAADLGSGFINGAAPLVGIEELADPPEVLIVLPFHDPLVAMILAGEFLFGLFERKIEMRGQSLDILLLEGDDRIGATIARTVQAVISGHLDLDEFERIVTGGRLGAFTSAHDEDGAANIATTRPE
jgi:hypothetical protein